MEKAPYRSGFVGILGPPNVGKSTLLNRILGEKISITSEKSQTTRHRILGVLTESRAQVVFLDTPGIHRPRGLLGNELVSQALGVIPEVDLILVLFEPRRRREDEELVIAALKDWSKPLILGLNKSDLIDQETAANLLAEYRQRLKITAAWPISALTGENLDALREEIIRHLPEGPPYYPEDTLTDQSMRLIAAEIIREQVFRLTGEEIPYSTAVTIEEFREGPTLVKISATIHVERDSQKKIVIGAGGIKLKAIGTAARQDIEKLIEVKVFLELFVRVQKNWRRDLRAIKLFGYKK